ncbi:MAG: FKBP-type peptidyl-prolyl cis-trans isomerase [Gemmatimonadales bacterium]
MSRVRSVLLTLAFGAALAGCRSGSSDFTAPEIEDVEFDPSLGVDLDQSQETSSGLWIRDLTIGNGAEVVGGSTVGMYYSGYLWNGAKFDERVAPAAPFTFTVGGGAVILGVDEGVRGMKVGGLRQLIIPPYLGYGPSQFGAIPGNSVLVFRIEIISVQ